MDVVDGLMQRKHLKTNWELLAIALGLGAYIDFINKKNSKKMDKKDHVEMLIQLWTDT